MDNQLNSSISIHEIIAAIRRRKWLLVICLIGTLTPVLIYNYKTIPVYQASTKMIFEASEKVMDLNPLGSFNKGNFIANQIEEMKTRSFSEEVYAQLPEDIHERFLSLNSFLPEYNQGTFIVGQIKGNLSFTPIRGTEVVKVAFDSEDPQLAQKVADMTAQVVMGRNLAIRRKKFSNVKKFIEQQFEIVKERLQQAENVLKEFKESQNITSLEAESREILARVTQAEVLFNQVQTQKKELQERLRAIQEKLDAEKAGLSENVLKTNSPMAVILKGRLIELEVTYSNFQVQGYPEDNPKMLDLINEIEQIKKNLVNETLKFQSEENFQSLLDPFSQIRKFVEQSIGLEVELQALTAKEKNLRLLLNNYNSVLGDLPEKEMKLVRLIRDKEVNDKLYLTLLEEREKSRISEASEIGNIRILEPARLPGAPFRPRKLLNIVVGIFSGMFLGIFLIFALEYVKSTVRTQEDIERELGLPVIAVIPKYKKDLKSLFGLNKNGNLLTKGGPIDSILFDAFNLLSFALDKNQQSTIMVTSTIPNEGKSTLSSMLAITSAQRGKKTLLIDADLRRPSLDSLFKVPREPGLSNLVIDQIQLQNKVFHEQEEHDENGDYAKVEKPGDAHIQLMQKQMIRTAFIEGAIQTFEKNLLFLPSGFIPSNPVRIWSSTIWQNIFLQLKDIVDIVFIDSPPIVGVAETSMMATYVDHILYCIAADGIETKILKRAFKMFSESSDGVANKIIGAVLNKADVADLYGSYKYYQYYSKNKKFSPEIPSADFSSAESSGSI